LGSPRVPFSGRTLVDEDQMLDQLDLIRLNLPPAFREASQIAQQRDVILNEAQRYAQELVAAAEQQAAQILDELGIVRQAEQMAQQIKLQAQQDCDGLRSQVVAEIDQMRLQAQREWESMRQQALSEKAAIQDDADTYAGDVLGQLERQLSDMLRVIQNGRKQLERPANEGIPAAPNKRPPEPSNNPSRTQTPRPDNRPRR
jgi:F0F1-type ATP synthase membrane subunit b/b'